MAMAASGISSETCDKAVQLLKDLGEESKIDALTSSIPSNASSEDVACTVFGLVLPEGSVTVQSSDYEALRTENWAHNAWLNPKCIIQPATVEHVAKAVKVLSRLDAKFATRSGGHNANVGWSNINGGIIVDLTKIDEITYSKDSGTIIVGTGQRWIQVYEALEADGVTPIGGRVAPVGVGGLTLGGGLSYLTHRHGVPADNVVNYEVVTADGEVVNANADERSDLFWALKGGTSNFGIVTRFTMLAIPIGKVWGGYIQLDIQYATEVTAAIVKYQNRGDTDLDSELCVQFLPNNKLIWINMIYSKPTEWPEIFADFKPFVDQGLAVNNTMAIRSWPDFINGQPGFLTFRFSFHTAPLKVNHDVFQKITQACNDASEAIGQVDAGGLIYVYQPISVNVVDAGVAKGGNALGLERVNQQWFGFATTWNQASDDDVGYRVAKSLGDRVDALTHLQGSFIPYRFMSDAGSDQDVIGSYGAKNVKKLRAVAAKYDPQGVFQRLEPGGFKLN